MRNVYLIRCTKAKQNYKCTAEEMYSKSSLFRISLNYALSKVSDKYSQIFVLSAKHHLLSLKEVITPYDNTLKSGNNSKWGAIIYNQLKELFDIENTNFIFLSGQKYMAPLLPYLKNVINPIPVENRRIGDRQKWLKNHIEDSTIVYAKNLRNIELRREVPKSKPGWYRWWAPKEAVEKLLNSPYISNKYLYSLISHLTKKNINGTDYYYIYVGIAVRESIRDRLHWHVNQKHAKSSVISGYLSTLRQTISSLVAGDQYNEKATNELIDMLIIEYFPIDLEIKSQEAKEKIESIEKYEIINNVLPLNLRDNKSDIVKDFLKELSKARKNSK